MLYVIYIKQEYFGYKITSFRKFNRDIIGTVITYWIITLNQNRIFRSTDDYVINISLD